MAPQPQGTSMSDSKVELEVASNDKASDPTDSDATTAAAVAAPAGPVEPRLSALESLPTELLLMIVERSQYKALKRLQ